MKVSILLALAIACELVGDGLFKLGSTYYGVLYYLVGTAFWFLALKNSEHFGTLICVFTIANMLAGIAIGSAVFNEVLTTRHYIGIALGIASVGLLSG